MTTQPYEHTSPGGNSLTVGPALAPTGGRAALLSVTSNVSGPRQSKNIPAADVGQLVGALYTAVGRDVIVADRLPEKEPNLWEGGGGTARASGGKVHFQVDDDDDDMGDDDVNMTLEPDEAEQAGIALILAARAARRQPSPHRVLDLARTLTSLDPGWPSAAPGERHITVAEGLLTNFEIRAREDV
ncbi:hypothetical protein [Streptosporangium sp. NPDC002524]|uniref:hypothetical protein n=1 Tax=Streptosporangium sp. NPDC002524 TaxID=3154537 RepID=UPI00331B1357